MTRVLDIAKMLGKSEIPNTDNKRLVIPDEAGIDSASIIDISTNVPINYYSNIDSLPVSDLTLGDRAFVESSGSGARLYLSNGSGWYNAALVNLNPRWDSVPLGLLDSTSIVDSATPLIITAKALDSDNPDTILVNQSFASDSAQYLVTITNDSSVWTFTPKSADSVGASVTAGDLVDSSENSFIYTFKWSDGIDFVSKAVTINYNTVDTSPRSLVLLNDWEDVWQSAAVEELNSSYTIGLTRSGNEYTSSTFSGGSYGFFALDMNMLDPASHGKSFTMDPAGFWFKMEVTTNVGSPGGQRVGLGLTMMETDFSSFRSSPDYYLASSGCRITAHLRSDDYTGYSWFGSNQMLIEDFPDPTGWATQNAHFAPVTNYYQAIHFDRVNNQAKLYHSTNNSTWTKWMTYQFDNTDDQTNIEGVYISAFFRTSANITDGNIKVELLDGEAVA